MQGGIQRGRTKLLGKVKLPPSGQVDVAVKDLGSIPVKKFLKAATTEGVEQCACIVKRALELAHFKRLEVQ